MEQTNKEFWRAKRVLLTGHTGFKGSWLSLWLQSMGANLRGLSLTPPTEPALFNVARVAEGMEHHISRQTLQALTLILEELEGNDVLLKKLKRKMQK